MEPLHVDEAFRFERSIDIDTYDRHAENWRLELDDSSIGRQISHEGR